MRNVVIYLFLFLCFSVKGQPTGVLNGLKGLELKQAVSSISKPKHTPIAITGENSVWKAFRTTDNIGGFVLDRYSTDNIMFSDDGVMPSNGMTIDYIVDLSWWGNNIEYGDVLKFDMYNIIPCNDNVRENKKDYPPGNVLTAVYDNGVWQAGYGEIAGVETNLYEPTGEYKGDFARVMMYMATVYPVNMWHGRGINFFQNNEYPVLNKYAQRLLLQWHREDPVSDIERNRNNEIEKIQGNRNLFVDYPQLVEHVWGNEIDNPFGIETERIALKSTYRISDNRIDLYHPLVPSNAEWLADGIAIAKDYILPTDLGIGVHELRYNTATTTGKLLIKIIE